MRKLSTIHLKDAEVLNETQLKQIYGGSGVQGRCEANCEYTIRTVKWSTLELIKEEKFVTQIETTCAGTCTATDNVGVTCSDGVNNKSCPKNQVIRDGSGILY